MPDYFEGAVYDYLTADRSLFISPQFYIELPPAGGSGKGRSWYVDALTVSPRTRTCYLCEITIAKKAQALRNRLAQWSVRKLD